MCNVSGCKDNWSYTSWITWSVISSKFANLSLPIYCTFLEVREYYNMVLLINRFHEKMFIHGYAILRSSCLKMVYSNWKVSAGKWVSSTIFCQKKIMIFQAHFRWKGKRNYQCILYISLPTAHTKKNILIILYLRLFSSWYKIRNAFMDF